jgi:ABC-type uncharacterized transport system ATPase component
LPLLLYDEHAAVMPPRDSRKTMDWTRFIGKKEKLTALLTSHNFSHALDRGDRPAMVNRGALAGDLARERRKEIAAQDMLNLFWVAGGIGKDQSEQVTL